MCGDNSAYFGTAGNDDTELRRNDIQPLGYVLADAMQAVATVADQAFRLDDIFNARKTGGKRATIGGARFGMRLSRSAVGFVSGMDGRDGHFHFFQCKVILFGISLLGFAAKGRLFESGDQFLQPFDPLVLANFTRLQGDQHRLQSSNIVWKIDRIQHRGSLPN
ncbi:hypothetical protein C8J38_11528 [Rhizobium sp. PP-WC-2G-219]|nr:hypothetical protein C8J38_11528 [Rhizobium sp. PP-WC-2G-219]